MNVNVSEISNIICCRCSIVNTGDTGEETSGAGAVNETNAGRGIDSDAVTGLSGEK